MHRLTGVIAFIVAFAGLASAQMSDPIPAKRLDMTRDVDFYGADLRAIFDTTLEACERACLSDPNCAAFTFNSRSNACFPKTDVTQVEPYEGAFSARVVITSEADLARARARVAELDFLTARDQRAALDLATGFARRHPGGSWSEAELARGARDAAARKEPLNALRWIGPAITKADRSAYWSDYARYALDYAATQNANRSTQREYRARAVQAATNAYLRAGTAPEQGAALNGLARALEQTGRGQQMVSALRLARAVAPSAQVEQAYAQAFAKYGFRITNHTVEANSAAPRICAQFSKPLDPRVDYTPYVQLPGVSFALSAEDRQLCVEGVQHGTRYQVTFRAGLPQAKGDGLARDVPLNVYVRDRAPLVRFPGRAYVLPKSPDAALPIVTVNLSEVDLTLSRISAGNVVRVVQDSYFGRPLSVYEEDYFESNVAETVWQGTGEVENTLNTEVTTRLPMAQAITDLPAGVYALQARVRGADRYDTPAATQWFVISDIGLATLKGADGLHVMTRSLGTATPSAGVKLSLLSRSNRVLAQVETDASGYARFEPGLTRGQGGAAPALVMAEQEGQDVAFLSLTDPAFDLSDRGVEGRAPAGPIDVFLHTDRGAYRAGEVIHATALARDGKAQALDGVPLTAILMRPDGVEYRRVVSNAAQAGGHVFALPVTGTAPRGTWTLHVHADPATPPLATRMVLVEDFLPERIDFDLSLPDAPLRLSDQPPLTLDVAYLFGAPGAGLRAEGDVTLRATRGLDGFPGYQFGRHDADVSPMRGVLPSVTTDDAGRAMMPLQLPSPDLTDRPFEAQIAVRVAEGSNRPVERRLSVPVQPETPLIGIRPLFDGTLPEGTEASFALLATSDGADPMAMRVKWTVNRVQRRYQWYSSNGYWNWEPITRRSRVATGEVALGSDPVTVSAPTEWGQYELVVERLDGAFAESSVGFSAGWYAPAGVTDTPDVLNVALDKTRYAPGDEALLRIVPRAPGKALVTVMSNRLIDMQLVDLPEGETTLRLPVTEEWGAGAYVSATVIRPLEAVTGRTPTRAVGLSYAGVETSKQRLQLTLDTPAEAKPRQTLDVALKVENVQPGETAFVTLAAVDVGILNITGHLPPDPSSHYFGQRKLGMEVRDLYGRLIDGRSGALGRIRSGGDALAQMRMENPPPSEELVAYFSGPLEVGADGMARARFDLPAFNGTVKVMALAWSGSGVGQASADVLVRDPIVVTASLPRFLAPGDSSRMRVDLTHATGPTGQVRYEVSGGLGALAAGVLEFSQGQSHSLSVPLTAQRVGMREIDIALITPDGSELLKTLTIPVQRNDPPVARQLRLGLAAGDTFTLSRDVFVGLTTGTGRATLAVGPLARFDAPGLLQTLDRYPYGCTEQTTSRALPLLYFDQVAQAMGLTQRDRIGERVDQAIARILSRQANSGGFGLWRAQSGDFWLDAYVTDFLSRARAQGYAVQQRAFDAALDNLRNRVNYAPDFDATSNKGGQDLAYALMVLAREGQANMGDLRYYADAKADAFATPLALAQLGAALAMYGDQPRADRMFAAAGLGMASRLTQDTRQTWRSDYGTNLRDAAAVLALATEAGTTALNTETLSAYVVQPRERALSTQESTWSLMAAHALIGDVAQSGFTVNGAPVEGPLVPVLSDDGDADPVAITNGSGRDTVLTLTTVGVPEEPEPRGGNGYALDRAYYTTDGAPVDPSVVAVGTRLVAVLTVAPFARSEARLIVDDPLPAGFEIDTPSLLQSGDIRALDWLRTAPTRTAEFRQDRFLAAVDWRSDKPFQLGYIVRAISPGEFHHPAALVEDMYRPQYRARTATARLTIQP